MVARSVRARSRVEFRKPWQNKTKKQPSNTRERRAWLRVTAVTAAVRGGVVRVLAVRAAQGLLLLMVLMVEIGQALLAIHLAVDGGTLPAEVKFKFPGAVMFGTWAFN
jgi:hypothetical protein